MVIAVAAHCNPLDIYIYIYIYFYFGSKKDMDGKNILIRIIQYKH